MEVRELPVPNEVTPGTHRVKIGPSTGLTRNRRDEVEMHTNNNVAMQEYRDRHRSRIRFRIYWILSVLATVIFLLFAATMLMVPGVLPSAKLWMLSVAAVALATSLGVGAWNFGTTDAPAMDRPLGLVMGVILLLQLAWCITGIVNVSVRMPR